MNIKFSTITFELDARETRVLRQAGEILDNMLTEVLNRDSTSFMVVDDDNHCESVVMDKKDLDSALIVLQSMV